MFRFTAAAAVAVAALAASASADDGRSYLFERSYYSHAPAKPVQVGHRAPIGGPQFTRPQGLAATGGVRWSRSQIAVRGRVVEQTFAWDSWVQWQGKY